MVVDGGKPLIGFLKQTDPFRDLKCIFRDDNYIVEANKDCAKNSVVYEITCNSCIEPVRDNMDIDQRPRDLGTKAGFNMMV